MKAISRREFGKSSGLFVLLISASNFLTGCLFSGSIESQIAAYVNLGLSALASIIKILAANGIVVSASAAIADASDKVKAAFADITVAIDDWKAADSTTKATALGRVSDVIQILQNRIVDFWNSLALPDGKVAGVISALLGVVTTSLAWFQTQLPPPPATARKAMPAKLAGTPVKRSPGEFKKSYNAVAEMNGYKQFDI